MSNYLDELRQRNNPAKLVRAVFDGDEPVAQDAASNFQISSMRLSVAAGVAAWAETSEDDLEAGENMADRMDALMVGVLDMDKDGELDDDELSLLDMMYNVLSEFLLKKGCEPADVDRFINDGDEDAALAIHEFVAGSLANGEDEELDELHSFAFDADSDASVMDAAYKMKSVVRGGKKMRVRKRISGRVRLSSKQKMGIKKMLRKSHSAAAQMSRAKSMRRRKSMGM
jgi:hypothetical protein